VEKVARHALWSSLLLCACVRRVVVADPQELANEIPPGLVDVKIVSDDLHPWSVSSGDAPLCTTPCTSRVGAAQDLLLRSGRYTLYLPDLGPDVAVAQRAVVIAEGASRGERTNGIVWTTFGGIGLVTGITLTAVGCSDTDSRGGTCVAGLITGGASALLTAAAIWMIVDALPKAHVIPVFKP
jgi:hypothetical protein